MDLQIDNSRPIALASVSGELTGSDAEQFTERLYDLATGDGATLAVDLSALDLIDSKGLAALINLTTRARLSGGNVVLVHPSAFVEGIFSVTRLNNWFDICSDIDEAVSRNG
ncbi:MAG: STAS domain-containing protein [Phycisphaerae bacterium]